MFDKLDFNELIKENKLYYIKYGRGAVIGVSCESLQEGIGVAYNIIRDSHQQDPKLIKYIKLIDDYVMFDIIVREEVYWGSCGGGEFKVTKKIPLSQITVESYQVSG